MKEEKEKRHIVYLVLTKEILTRNVSLSDPLSCCMPDLLLKLWEKIRAIFCTSKPYNSVTSRGNTHQGNIPGGIKG